MYYNDDFRSSDQYRYTNRDQLPRDDYAPDPNRVPVQPKKQGFFHRTAVKVTALILACAVAGGLAGWGGAAIAKSSGTEKATIQQSDRQPVSVQVKTVDGQTKMEPAEVYASVVNSAVSINCSATSTNIFGQTTQSASSGSGFIITEDGYVVTNYHVISGASSVQVTLYNGDTYDATVIGGDSDYDVAVLKIEASGLQPVTLGESADVNVGDTVLAIGNPLGELTFSMSQGIVSSCDRAINVDGTPFNMIQVDCSINPGNSGGPLVNLYGEVVGIVSAKYSSYSSTTVEGLGFAIPISDVRSIITDIMENGAVTDKAYMAITAGTMTEQMAAQYQHRRDPGRVRLLRGVRRRRRQGRPAPGRRYHQDGRQDPDLPSGPIRRHEGLPRRRHRDPHRVPQRPVYRDGADLRRPAPDHRLAGGHHPEQRQQRQ